jgi:hypothetical protein
MQWPHIIILWHLFFQQFSEMVQSRVSVLALVALFAIPALAMAAAIDMVSQGLNLWVK